MDLSVSYNSNSYVVELSTTINDFLNKNSLNAERKIIAVKNGQKIVPLSSAITGSVELSPITLDHSEGIRVYKNSVIFLVTAVFRKLFPELEIVINHTISGGIYCTVTNKIVDAEMVSSLKISINEAIENDISFLPVKLPKKKAIEYFENAKINDTANHLKSNSQSEVELISFNDQLGFTFGILLPSSGYINAIEIIGYASGFIVRYPNHDTQGIIPQFIEQPMLFSIFREYERWQTILGIRNVEDMNELLINKKMNELVHVAEALHEKKISAIADEIARRSDTVRVVLIAGPSSSGKTTFSKRLGIHLKVHGINTLPISLDNYFKNRTITPKDENGDYDFESLYALDLDLFNNHLSRILNGEKVQLPKYNFTTGMSAMSDEYIKIDQKTILIFEGIHCLNDELTKSVFEIMKYKIYVSAFTPIGIDNCNRIPTTDLRLVRRIVRDNFYRNYSALDTLKRWNSVRKGEKKWIFPHQNKAHTMFNTTLIYEPAMLKTFAQPLLEKITDDEPTFEEANRLRTFLSFFTAMDPSAIPGTSILREFIGGSHFKY